MDKYNKKKIKVILTNELEHSYEIRGEDPKKWKERIFKDVNFMVESIERELTTGVDAHILTMKQVEKLDKEWDSCFASTSRDL